MSIDIILTNRTGSYNAIGTYDGGMVVVKKGSRIFPEFSSCIRGGKTAKGFRENSEYVDAEYYVIKDCVFKSPSTAAQFVTGRSVDGYNAWKVDAKETLGTYLKERGLR